MVILEKAASTGDIKLQKKMTSASISKNEKQRKSSDQEKLSQKSQMDDLIRDDKVGSNQNNSNKYR
jgi:hypothetical protein